MKLLHEIHQRQIYIEQRFKQIYLFLKILFGFPGLKVHIIMLILIFLGIQMQEGLESIRKEILSLISP